MEHATDKLTKSSHEDEYIDLGQDLTERAKLDLTGQHKAEIFFVQSMVAKNDDPYLKVGARILEGKARDKVVYGTVFKDGPLMQFVQVLGLDPDTVGSTLTKGQVIEKKVVIEVAPAKGGGRENSRGGGWVIRDFAPLA